LNGILVSMVSDGFVLVEEDGSEKGVDKVVPHLICIGSGIIDGPLEMTCTPLLVLREHDWDGGNLQRSVVEDEAAEL
jgi:hypothetical protein